MWWTTHGLDKIRPSDPVPATPSQTIKLFAARNEFEPFQLALRAEAADMDAVDIDVSDLQGPGDAILSKNNISIYLERYLNLNTPSSVDGGTGEWPDPLVPRIDRYAHEKRNAFPFKLVRGRNQAVWVDIYVPRAAIPGQYRGELHGAISGKPRFTIPVVLEIWNFELPSTSSLITTFAFSGLTALHQHFGRYTNDKALSDITSLYQKAALGHRITLDGSSGTPLSFSMVDGKVRVNWEQYDSEVHPFLDGLVFSADEALPGAKTTSITLRTPPALKTEEQQIYFWRQVAEHFRQKGWFDRLFNYLWDEPKPNEYPAMAQLGRTVHRADPELKNLVTAPLHREWTGFVDIWTPVINCFERKPKQDDYCEMTVSRSVYDSELAGGKQLWWYQACSSHGCNIVGGEYFRGWPSYMIDHDGVRNRIMEWLSWKYDIKGELYFSTDEAFANKNPWKDVRLFGGHGDGTLFYPGRPDVVGGTTQIPIESIRLKLIREGLEDYEYLGMLTKLAGSKTAADLVNSIVRTTYDFDHNPEKLYAVRESVGREISRLSR